MQPWKWFLWEVARLIGHVYGALVETFNWVGLQSGTWWFQKCIQLYRLMLWHVRAVNLFVCIPKRSVNHWRLYLFVLMASVWNENTEFFQVRCWQIWNFKRIPVGDIQSFDIPVEMFIRDWKNYRKSIIEYLAEDREVSEEAMMSFQNGIKVRKNVCCISIWDTQMRLLSSM